jgi:hypothetical protein
LVEFAVKLGFEHESDRADRGPSGLVDLPGDGRIGLATALERRRRDLRGFLKPKEAAKKRKRT